MGRGRFATVVTIATLFCIGCATQMQPKDGDAAVTTGRSDATAPAPQSPEEENTASIVPSRLDLPDTTTPGLVSFVEEQASGARVLRRVDRPPLVYVTTAPTRDRNAILAILDDNGVLSTYFQPFAPDGTRRPYRIEPLVEGGTVTDYGAIDLDTADGPVNGIRVVYTVDGENDEFFVLTTSSQELYIVQTPISPVHQTVFRDLDGDGRKEMTQYSRVFEAVGRREVIVDAFQWRNDRFVYDRSISLLRRINERLTTLRRSVEAAAARDVRYDAAFRDTGDGGVPPPSQVFPVLEARVPELPELLVGLGRAQWQIGHEVALVDAGGGVSVYRVELLVRANPYLENPVTIVGLDGEP